MSKVCALYHIVFCTAKREMTLSLEHLPDLYKFITSIIKENNCKLIRIGGIQNHVHILIDLNPAVSLSSLMQTVKGTSSSFLRRNPKFPWFGGWAKEYFACSVSPDRKNTVIEYIRNQQTHHLGSTFDNEILSFYKYAHLEYDSRDLQ